MIQRRTLVVFSAIAPASHTPQVHSFFDQVYVDMFAQAYEVPHVQLIHWYLTVLGQGTHEIVTGFPFWWRALVPVGSQ